MTTMSDPAVPTRSPALRAIVLGGLLGGTGDFVFACIFYGFKLRVFQSVAAGLIGRPAAFAGGAATYLLGVGLHYGIAGIWAALFWLASRRWPELVRNAVPMGLAYGLVVFYGMNLVVLPLSALHTSAWPPPFAAWPMAMHMLVVGLPIALAVRKYSPTAGAAG